LGNENENRKENRKDKRENERGKWKMKGEKGCRRVLRDEPKIGKGI